LPPDFSPEGGIIGYREDSQFHSADPNFHCPLRLTNMNISVPAIIEASRQRAGLTARTVDIPGFRIAYLDGGSGPALLLLHGIGSDKDAFVAVAAGLTSRYRVIIPDLPGFGDSSRPQDARYRIQHQVERVAAFGAALGLTSFDLGGNSMGGWIAGIYAATYPQQVNSLWLLAPAGVKEAAESEMVRRIRAHQGVPLFAQNAEEFDAVMQFLYGTPPVIPPDLRQYLIERQTAHFALNTRIFFELNDDLESAALERRLAGSRIPALVAWGDRDAVLDVSGAALLKEALPAAEMAIMPGIGHVPMLEAAARSVTDYLAFRKRVGG
jgi:triacylglycerol lipase